MHKHTQLIKKICSQQYIKRDILCICLRAVNKTVRVMQIVQTFTTDNTDKYITLHVTIRK